MIYDHQTWQAGAGDMIMSRSRNFEKCYDFVSTRAMITEFEQNNYEETPLHGSTILVPVLISSIFSAVVAKKRKNFEKIFVVNRENTACKQQMTTIKLLNKTF